MMKLTQVAGLADQMVKSGEGGAVNQHVLHQVKDEKVDASHIIAKSNLPPCVAGAQGQAGMTRLLTRVSDYESADRETLLVLFAASGVDPKTRMKMLNALLPHINDLVTSLTHESSDANRKKNILDLVYAIQINHDNKCMELNSEQRSTLANALADVFMARTTLSKSIAEIRSRLVGKDLRRQHSVEQAKKFVLNALDLGVVPHDEKIEEQELTHTRTAKIVEIDGKKYRVKNIKYGNVRAAEEVLMAKFYALSGLECPNVKLAINGGGLFRYDHNSRRDFEKYQNTPKDFVVVASELVPAFEDLGRLVLQRHKILPMILEDSGASSEQKYDQALNSFKEAQQKEQILLESQQKNKDKNNEWHAALIKDMRLERAVQLKERLKMVALLPDHYKRSTITAYCVSRLVADWDFENFDLYNFGFNGKRSMLVDFGNCGAMGFGGMQKSDSFERANTRARESDPHAPNVIRKEDAKFDGTVAPSLTGIGSLPRAIPIAPLLQSITTTENWIANPGRGRRDVAKHDLPPLSPVLEAVFRMSLIPDQAFHHLAKENWPDGQGLFPYFEDDKLRLSADEYANFMMQRRDALTAQFKPSEMQAWIERNSQHAESAHHEVAAAVASLTGILIEPYFGGDTLMPIKKSRRLSGSTFF